MLAAYNFINSPHRSLITIKAQAVEKHLATPSHYGDHNKRTENVFKKKTKIKMFPRVHSLTVFWKVNTLELTLEIICLDTYCTVQSVTTIDIQNSDVLCEARWSIKILREGICKQSFSCLSVLSSE